MAHAKPAVLEAAMSARRRSTPSVSALPAYAGGAFADRLRNAAIELGDGVANSLMARDLPGQALRWTEAYLARWPTLPSTPAEHAAPWRFRGGAAGSVHGSSLGTEVQGFRGLSVVPPW